jgi:alpha-beta hydrolase superfamily lysophospholipase
MAPASDGCVEHLDATKIGLAVFAVDLRGRGKSDGEHFYVTKFSDYVEDVAGLIREARSQHSGVPVLLLGHSAGGAVSCLYAVEHQRELAGVVRLGNADARERRGLDRPAFPNVRACGAVG